MKHFHNHKILLFLLTFFLLVGMLLLVFALQQQQQTRSRAEKSTTLALTPDSSPSSPITKQVGDMIPLAVMVTPGTNLVTVTRLVITYDQTKLQPDAGEPFSPNETAFPTIVEGPFVSPGKISLTLSIGSDPTKVITSETLVGILNLQAIDSTEEVPTIVSISTSSEVLSAGEKDQATENVLNTTTPAFIKILPNNMAVTFSLNLLLHGIGHSGDNPNPTAYSLSNQDPRRPVRHVEVEVIKGTTNERIATASGTVTFNETNGNFVGTAGTPVEIPSGQYLIKVHSTHYLRKLIPGFVTVRGTSTVNLPQTSLVTSDGNDDNKLNILDYNLILDCYSGSTPARACGSTDKKDATDSNDDGSVNQYDYNLFLRELSVQNGD